HPGRRRRHLLGGLHHPGALGTQRLNLGRIDVVHDQREPLRHEIQRHRSPHVAESHEPYRCHAASSQKKNVRFLASSTLWSSTILRRAILNPPFTRRSRSSRLPTSTSVSVSTRFR